MDNTSTAGTAALAYAEKGFAVFPIYEIGPAGACACSSACSSPGKHPRIGGGFQNASKDAEIIRQWWTQWPTANVGIATGAASGVFVLDVDRKNNGLEELQSLMTAHGDLPGTLYCITGGGGLHAYFKLPAGKSVPCSAGRFAPGIDVRGDGGYVVAPPSNHISGGRYEWH